MSRKWTHHVFYWAWWPTRRENAQYRRRQSGDFFCVRQMVLESSENEEWREIVKLKCPSIKFGIWMQIKWFFRWTNFYCNLRIYYYFISHFHFIYLFFLFVLFDHIETHLNKNLINGKNILDGRVDRRRHFYFLFFSSIQFRTSLAATNTHNLLYVHT